MSSGPGKFILIVSLILAGCASGPRAKEARCPVQVTSLKVPSVWQVSMAQIEGILAKRGYKLVDRMQNDGLTLGIEGSVSPSSGVCPSGKVPSPGCSLEIQWAGNISPPRDWIPASSSVQGALECVADLGKAEENAESCRGTLLGILAESPVCTQ